jgi:PAS domain S-box-containing protein
MLDFLQPFDSTYQKMGDTLCESEQRYRQLIEHAPAMIAVHQNEQFVYINSAGAQFLGASTPAQIIGMSLWKIVPEELRTFVQSQINLIKDQKVKSPVSEQVVVRIDGERIYAQVTGIPVMYQGKPAIQLVMIDITKRKHAEIEIARHAHMMTALYETTRNLIEEHNVSQLLATIVERATQLVGAIGGGLYVCEPDQRQVRCVVSYNTPYDPTGTILMFGEGIAGRVAMTGIPLIINDYHAWEGRVPIYEQENPFSKVLSVPMIWQEAVIGVLYMLGHNSEVPFTQDDQQVAMLFANHAAIAVQNARMIEQVQGYTTTLEERVIERTQKLQDENEQRKQAEAHLKTSLKEKELLLREVYHRVKNNLQVISSILNLQASHYEEDLYIVSILKEMQGRVRSMALVHEKLYQTKDMVMIDFGDYVRHLVAMLLPTHNITTETVLQDISIAHISLGLDTAVPCGLIINELISNVFKYAFPDLHNFQNKETNYIMKKITISMELTDSHHYVLILADNGIGLPTALDIQNTKTLGLQLVVLLVEQLGGTIQVNREGGTTFRIIFSPIIYANRRGNT